MSVPSLCFELTSVKRGKSDLLSVESPSWVDQSELCVFPSCRLAAPSYPARPPEQGDVRPVSVPDLPSLWPALACVRRSGLLRHCLGHFHWRDEAHFLRPWRRDHPTHRPTWKLQCKSSDIKLVFFTFLLTHSFFFLSVFSVNLCSLLCSSSALCCWHYIKMLRGWSHCRYSENTLMTLCCCGQMLNAQTHTQPNENILLFNWH